jgi:hypothetical protein
MLPDHEVKKEKKPISKLILPACAYRTLSTSSEKLCAHMSFLVAHKKITHLDTSRARSRAASIVQNERKTVPPRWEVYCIIVNLSRLFGSESSSACSFSLLIQKKSVTCVVLCSFLSFLRMCQLVSRETALWR